MADECDNAQRTQALYLQTALENRMTRPHGASRHACEECGAIIPEARRRAVPGVRLCIACQEEADARHY